jgi:hypothetical protein
MKSSAVDTEIPHWIHQWSTSVKSGEESSKDHAVFADDG